MISEKPARKAAGSGALSMESPPGEAVKGRLKTVRYYIIFPLI